MIFNWSLKVAEGATVVIFTVFANTINWNDLQIFLILILNKLKLRDSSGSGRDNRYLFFYFCTLVYDLIKIFI